LIILPLVLRLDDFGETQRRGHPVERVEELVEAILMEVKAKRDEDVRQRQKEEEDRKNGVVYVPTFPDAYKAGRNHVTPKSSRRCPEPQGSIDQRFQSRREIGNMSTISDKTKRGGARVEKISH
jgi:hypothetical protein